MTNKLISRIELFISPFLSLFPLSVRIYDGCVLINTLLTQVSQHVVCVMFMRYIILYCCVSVLVQTFQED